MNTAVASTDTAAARFLARWLDEIDALLRLQPGDAELMRMRAVVAGQLREARA